LQPPGPGCPRMAEAAHGGHEFECNICLEPVTEPVVSLCGHLFCWPCVHRWLTARPQAPSCPVCKGPISEDALVPVYGRSGRSGPELGPPVPPRPSGHRLREQSGQRHLLLGGLRISVGIDTASDNGGLGLSLTDLALELQESLEELEVAHLLGPLASRLFLWIAAVFGLWLLIV
ncbi:hypothetical protein BOX15_Mlig029692g3, partial [Macrostomum lignano]